MFAVLARSVEWRLGEFKAQEVANTAWAFVIVFQSDALLLRVLPRQAEWQVGDFNVQDFANTAWALATADEPAQTLLEPISIVSAIESQGNKPQVAHYDAVMEVLAASG